MTVEYQKVWTTMNDLEMVTSKICSAREIVDSVVDAIQHNDYDKAETLANAAYEFLEYYLQEFDDKFKLAWQATVGDLRDSDKEAYDAVMKERDYYEGKAPLSCDKDDPSPECKGAWDSFWEENYYPEEHQQYTEEELNAMCDKAELDAEVERIRQEGGYDWTPSTSSQDKKYKDQNGVTYTEYIKAKIEANSAWNDGWTQQHYQKIVDKYEGKKTLNYDEAIAAGWEMTADGFWMPPQNKKKWVLPVEECKDADTDETEYFVSFPQDLLDAAKLKEGDEIKWVDNGNGTFTIVKVTKPLGPDEC